MRFSTLLATAFLTAATFSTGETNAGTLERHGAKIVTASMPMTTAVSSRTGARTVRSIPASYGRHSDRDFRGMVKLAMKFDVGDGRVMTEHCGGTVITSRWSLSSHYSC